MMRIGIIGSRGVPNNYGGFGQLAQYLAEDLVKRGHEVIVYNSHNHDFQESMWKGVQIVHCYDPEYKYGSFGQFIYDLNCIKDTRKRKLDVILQLGYTSSSIWFFLLPKKVMVATNMDGLEWKRSKYNWAVQQFLKVAEWLAAKTSDYLIADSIIIAQHLKKRFGKKSALIAYGAIPFTDPNVEVLKPFGLEPFGFDLIIARMEPENNIESILKAYQSPKNKRILVVIGNIDGTKHGKKWKHKYTSGNIRFLGTIFDIEILNNLRFYSAFYFHGHSVGGTNPSLLEAMAAKAFIIAHDNAFNRAVLEEDAHYFTDESSIEKLLEGSSSLMEKREVFTTRNLKKVSEQYTWPMIVDKYENILQKIVGSSKK